MPPWIVASLAFFGYVAAAALAVPGLHRRARILAFGGSVGGVVIGLAGHHRAPIGLVHDWLLPLALLVLAYWTSGLLFAAPMPRVERRLAAIDRTLHVDQLARAAPRWLAELLELAYCGVYPLIPFALLIYLRNPDRPDADSFWTVVLVTDFICFGFLPWLQTRPPRALLTAEPWESSIRRFNLALLGRASIQANTFPSGHAAEALAIALLLSAAPPPLAAAGALFALLISAGAVLGRYHYAADAIAGWVVALVVWLVLAA